MILELKNIRKEYDHPVLKGICHIFSSGKLYVLKGVSGCGKSTLLNIIGGIEPFYSGDVILDGKRQAHGSDGQRNACGYIYQQSLLLAGITVRENLRLIQNGDNRIAILCSELGITPLLDKYPEELSGGERQRVSIARALLRDAQILLADEPTASLDDANSRRIADLLAGLRAENRILIVATHEHYFDEYADEIIDLKYGVIEKIRERESGCKEQPLPAVEKSQSKAKPIRFIQFNLKRGKSSLRPLALLPLALIFTIIMLVSTVQNCFSGEYYRFIKQSYPIEAFNLRRNRYEAAPASMYKNNLLIYEQYQITEGNVTAYYLAEKPDSVLAIDGMLEYGSFPAGADEIIISSTYAATELHAGENLKGCIGRKVSFCGKEFTVSGILYKIDRSVDAEKGNRNDGFYSYLFSDIYYTDVEKAEGALIFVPYQSLKALGVPRTDNAQLRCSYRGLFDDDTTCAAIKAIALGANHSPGSSIAQDFTLNIFEAQIRDAQSTVNIISAIFSGILLVCFVIACVFISAQVQLELFYRRKELGFLQIFGLPKKQLKALVLTGYALKISLSALFSAVLYAVCLLVYYFLTGHRVFFNFLHTLAAALFIAAFYILAVRRSISKFLRGSIIELITH